MNMHVHVWSHNKLDPPGFDFIAEQLFAVCKNFSAVHNGVVTTKSYLQITTKCHISEQGAV